MTGPVPPASPLCTCGHLRSEHRIDLTRARCDRLSPAGVCPCPVYADSGRALRARSGTDEVPS